VQKNSMPNFLEAKPPGKADARFRKENSCEKYNCHRFISMTHSLGESIGIDPPGRHTSHCPSPAAAAAEGITVGVSAKGTAGGAATCGRIQRPGTGGGTIHGR